MADKEASLIIRLKDEVTGGLSKLKLALTATAAAFAGITAFAISAFKAFEESEIASNKLTVALKNQGITSSAVKNDLLAYSLALQKTTAFSDESVTETQALLVTFGLAGDQLKRTTKAALDLSVGLGVDLKTATLILGKAAAGETGTLGRYGIKISETIPPSEKLNAVLTELNNRFGGSAEAQLNTFTGRMENLKNRVGELKEKIGAELLPVFESWAGWVARIVEGLERITGATNQNMSVNELARQQILADIEARRVQQEVVTSGILAQSEADRIAYEQTLLMNQRKLADLDAKIAKEKLADSQIVASNKNRIAIVKTSEEELAKAKKKIEDDNLKNVKLTIGENQDSHVKLYEFYKKRNEERVANMYSTLNTISTLATSSNKTLAAIGKAAAIAQATIDTYRAINVALASAPPPFNFALAALVGVAGFANVAKISGVALAQGGIVSARQGGTLATIGEGGRSEAVIPLDDPETKEKLGDTFGGTTINISAGMIIADDYAVNEFAKKIDVALYGLRRNNLSVALDRI